VPGYEDAKRQALTSSLEFNEDVRQGLDDLEDPSDYTIFMSAAVDLTRQEFRAKFAATVRALKARGSQIYFVSTTPRFRHVKTCIIEDVRENADFVECQFNLAQALNRDYFTEMQHIADGLGIGFIHLRDFFCDGERCHIARDGVLFMRDDGRFTVEVAGILATCLAGRMRPASIHRAMGAAEAPGIATEDGSGRMGRAPRQRRWP